MKTCLVAWREGLEVWAVGPADVSPSPVRRVVGRNEHRVSDRDLGGRRAEGAAEGTWHADSVRREDERCGRCVQSRLCAPQLVDTLQ